MSDQPTIITIETPSLGDRSYLAHDGEVAFVVDPQRDIDRVLEVADEAGVRITDVFETHIHNDYLTGGLALAQRLGARYHVNAEDEVAFEREPIRDGAVVEVSPRMRVRAIATPGHTFTHLSYALEAGDGAADATAVFTGGSLLFGATGRPDLLGAEHTDALVHHQYASVHRLADAVPDRTEIMPTHGFGSFCSAGTSSGADASTMGREKEHNPALTQTEEQWVADTLAGLDAYPAYYVHMTPENLQGPAEPDLGTPERADKQILAERIDAGEWVVDLRTRTAFAAGHVIGTMNVGLDGQFSTYLGWLLPWGASVTLLGESAEQVAVAQRELARIGVDRIAGAATGDPDDWTDHQLGTVQRALFADLSQVRHHRPVHVLDVRQVCEFTAEHIEGAQNVPLGELIERVDEVPHQELWVHCGSGYRASIATSFLMTRGYRAVLVDDSFAEGAAEAALPLTSSH